MPSFDMLSFLSIMPLVFDILPDSLDIASVFLSILLSILESFPMPGLLMASSAKAAGAKARPEATVAAISNRSFMVTLLEIEPNISQLSDDLNTCASAFRCRLRRKAHGFVTHPKRAIDGRPEPVVQERDHDQDQHRQFLRGFPPRPDHPACHAAHHEHEIGRASCR